MFSRVLSLEPGMFCHFKAFDNFYKRSFDLNPCLMSLMQALKFKLQLFIEKLITFGFSKL